MIVASISSPFRFTLRSGSECLLKANYGVRSIIALRSLLLN
jgi:hypothetical protein